MAICYITFGQSHVHHVRGKLFDKNCVCKIVAEDPEQIAYDVFGHKWARRFSQRPDMSHYSRGVIEL